MPKPIKTMDVGARRWLAKYARRNYWRVAAWYDLDDLLQDGLMCWCVVATRYKRANRRHLMALFQRTFSNHVHRLANRKTDCLEFPTECIPDIAFCPDAEMAALVNEAPSPLRQCLRQIVTRPELLALPMGQRPRQTTTQWLRAITGVDSDLDLASELRNLLRAT